jgi:hypothetical protein
MRLGVLGTDAGIADLVAAAAARGDTILHPEAGEPEATAHERFLDPAVCDVVAVGADGWNAARADGVRMLVQAARPVVLSHPLEMSMLWAYEIDMIRRDAGGVVIPFLPDRLHPFVARLKEHVETGIDGRGPLGPLESVRLERELPDRTRETVLAALARDVDLVRVLVGEPARLATLGAGDPDSAWPTLAVGFTGPDQVPARWQVVPGTAAGLTIALQHARGEIAVEAPAAGVWTWREPPAGRRPAEAFERGRAILDVVDAAVAGGRPLAGAALGTPPAQWNDAARAIELADTVPRSLARGRAIDLHQEEFSELSTFRGTMASLGCGLVLLGLLVLVLATLVAGIATAFDWEFGKNLTAAWPTVVLAVLVGFLALQLLPTLVGARAERRDRPDGSG